MQCTRIEIDHTLIYNEVGEKVVDVFDVPFGKLLITDLVVLQNDDNTAGDTYNFGMVRNGSQRFLISHITTQNKESFTSDIRIVFSQNDAVRCMHTGLTTGQTMKIFIQGYLIDACSYDYSNRRK